MEEEEMEERIVRGRGDDFVKVKICIENSENMIHARAGISSR